MTDTGFVFMIGAVAVICLLIVIALAVTAPAKPHDLNWYRKNEGYCSYCGGLMILRVERKDSVTIKSWSCKDSTHSGHRLNHDAIVIDTLSTPNYSRLTGAKTGWGFGPDEHEIS